MPGPKTPVALLVDDDPLQSKVISAVLKKFGINTETVATSKEFIERLKSTSPDLCLIDLNIEGIGTGFAIIEAVRKVLGSKPNLIVVSGTSEPNAIAHAMEVGANDFIVKPVDREVLISKVSRYIETAQLLDARAPLLPVPEGGAPASIDIEFEIQAIDELGIKIIGPHLVSKGVAILLRSPLIHEITGKNQSILFTVTSTWAEEDGKFGAEAEFDTTNESLLTAVRRWLANHPNPATRPPSGSPALSKP